MTTDPRVDTLAVELQGIKDIQQLRSDDIRQRLEDHENRLRGTASYADLIALQTRVDKMDDRLDGVTEFLATARGGYLVLLAAVGVIAPIVGQWLSTMLLK